jgi:hypothetical protein
MRKTLLATQLCALLGLLIASPAWALDAVEMKYGATYKGEILGLDVKSGILTIRTEEGVDKKLEWKDVNAIDRQAAAPAPPERYGDQLSDPEKSEEGLSQMRLGAQIFGAAYLSGALLCAIDCPSGNKAPYIPFIGGVIEMVKEKYSVRGGIFALLDAAQLIGFGIAINGYNLRRDALQATEPPKKALLLQPLAARDGYGARVSWSW